MRRVLGHRDAKFSPQGVSWRMAQRLAFGHPLHIASCWYYTILHRLFKQGRGSDRLVTRPLAVLPQH